MTAMPQPSPSTARLRDELRQLWWQMAADERHRGFYTRALIVGIALLAAAIVVLAVAGADTALPAHPACRATAAGPWPPAHPLEVELVRDGAAAVDVLRGIGMSTVTAEPAHAAALCRETRVTLHRGWLVLDSALFIPLYLMLGLLALGWALMATQRLGKVPRRTVDPPLAIGRGLWAVVLASAALVAAAAVVDMVENTRAHRLLDLAVAPGPVASSDVDLAAGMVRQAALTKWMLVGAWASTLMLLALALRARLRRLDPVCRSASLVAGAMAAVAALAVAGLWLGAGPGWLGWPWQDEARERQWIQVGFWAVLAFVGPLLLLHALLPPPGPPPGPAEDEPAPIPPGALSPIWLSDKAEAQAPGAGGREGAAVGAGRDQTLPAGSRDARALQGAPAAQGAQDSELPPEDRISPAPPGV